MTVILQEKTAEIEEQFPIEMEVIGPDKNHRRLPCSTHPNITPGWMVQNFKSIKAREIIRLKTAVKRVL